jgi:hypothetical protein
MRSDKASDQSADSANAQPSHPPTAKVGSSIATLWLKVGQENQPPASIPSTLLPSGNCPQCEQPLAPPLQSSGRQVCMKCGWTDKPRNAGSNATLNTNIAEPDAEPTDVDLLNLLEKAAFESLKNMEPRKKPRR